MCFIQMEGIVIEHIRGCIKKKKEKKVTVSYLTENKAK